MVIAHRYSHPNTRNSSHFSPVNVSIPDAEEEDEPDNPQECQVSQSSDLDLI
ncbi:hypothetical protein DPMN_103066 [Dreissena polymorpha]|uniref:Uncharacterized protein n=1 Tax=Dreissena polymorpha TaxID=45954 RepID=A0A9D4K279_DREPO|nr:hypothetical protein DPMN_103066 [Dreissena polymorpha]